MPPGEAYEGGKAVIRRSGNLLLNEIKKSDFASTEAVTVLNRLLKFRKGQQENAAALPQVDLTHSMAALAAVTKYLNVSLLGSLKKTYSKGVSSQSSQNI